MKKYSLIFLALALTGCGVNPKPTPEGQAVKVVENKPANCKELGKLDTTGYHANKEEAKNILLNKVVSMGGNTVRIEEAMNFKYGGMVIGSNDYYGYVAYAYNCPKN